MRTNWDFNFGGTTMQSCLKYIKNTLRSVLMWKDGTNDKYETESLMVIDKQSGKLGQNGSIG